MTIEIIDENQIKLYLNEGSADTVTLSGAQTLTSKTIALGSNTVTGTKAQFNAALTDGDFLFSGDAQPIDADLTAIAALAGTSGLLKKTAADTWTLDTTEYGYLGVPQNSSSANYTCVLADAGKHLLHPSADTTARTFTIPANSSVAYPIGTAITFINQNGAGVLTIAITTDTMRLAGAGTTGSRTLAANGVATAVKVAAAEWIISGVGLT